MLEKILPIQYMGKGSISDSHKYFINAKFISDFGVFKKDEEVETLHLDLDQCTIMDYKSNRIQLFKLNAENNIL